MADAIAPNQDVTFTIKKAPRREAQRKTIQRLMRMQPDIQRGLSKLARQRKRHDNRPVSRAGVEWVIRVSTTKLTRVDAGEQFTIRVTPHIIADIKSVEQYLDAKVA